MRTQKFGVCIHGIPFENHCPQCGDSQSGLDPSNLESCVRAAKAAESFAVYRDAPREDLRRAVGMIDVWARYTSRSKGSSGIDVDGREQMPNHEASRRSIWIESVLWFANTRPVLEHVFIDYQPLSSYRLRKPGQDFGVALMAHALDARWKGENPPASGPAVVLGRFVIEVANEWLSNPLPKINWGYLSDAEDAIVTVTSGDIEAAEERRRLLQRSFDEEHYPKTMEKLRKGSR